MALEFGRRYFTSLQSISVGNGAHQYFMSCYLEAASPSEPGLAWHSHQAISEGDDGLKTIV